MRACMRGCWTPASFMLCAVPGRPLEVPGREAVLGLRARASVPLAWPSMRAFGAASSPFVSAFVAVRNDLSSASSASLTGTGRSSRNSSGPSRASAFCSSSGCEVQGLPSSSSSRSDVSALSRSTSTAAESRLPPTSRISSEGRLLAKFSGIPSIRLRARPSSAISGSTGRERRAAVVSRLPDTSSVARLGSGATAPASFGQRKASRSRAFPSSRSSSSLPRPLRWSCVTSAIWLSAAQSTSRPPSPSSPSSDFSWLRERCSSLSLESFERPRPSFEILFLSRFRYSSERRVSKPSTALMQLSSRCRAARLVHFSRQAMRPIWQL
mmetsp:Transcript_66661/g.195626  ORF Transcript_66661/g.195626 Transcript_66661/m.195626 type:complete len:325 (+) Transcript_66661:540-1514(+)